MRAARAPEPERHLATRGGISAVKDSLAESAADLPQAVIQQLAAELAESYLRPEVARTLLPFIFHEPLDLNVSRVARAGSISRWTLQRRVRASTGSCAKHLVAEAQLLMAMASLLARIQDGGTSAPRPDRPLTRRERRVLRAVVGMPVAAVTRVLEAGGASAAIRLLSERCGESLVRATDDSSMCSAAD